MIDTRYPLIISDFDGTLVRRDGIVSEENKNAIARHQQNGGFFVISTGRMPLGIFPRVKELGLQGAVSACNGSVILDIESGKLLREGKIPHETTLQVVKKMEEMSLHIHLYELWDYYCNMDDEALKTYENIVGIKAKLVLDRPLFELVREGKISAYKILVMVPEEDCERVLNELKQENFQGCEVLRSSRFLVEVVSKTYSKGTTVEFLAEYYGVPIEKTVAIGDQLNDIPMIERAGLGVAVQNADDRVKAVADFVTQETNETNAVAEIIQKFGLYEEKKV